MAHGSRFRVLVVGHDDPAFADCLAIRMKVFVDEQRFTVEQELDGLDEETTHLLLLDHDGAPVGTLRYFPAPKRKLGRLAVLQPYRKTGAARALLLGLDEHMRHTDEAKPARLYAHAQVRSMGFYERTGWTKEGEEFLEDGDPHVTVWRDVPAERDPATPELTVRLAGRGS